jgi:hypothetical protein
MRGVQCMHAAAQLSLSSGFLHVYRRPCALLVHASRSCWCGLYPGCIPRGLWFCGAARGMGGCGCAARGMGGADRMKLPIWMPTQAKQLRQQPCMCVHCPDAAWSSVSS